jgi:uncharacterized protein (TIGR03435 family)
MDRIALIAMSAGLLAAGPAHLSSAQQVPRDTLRFEVASVRPHRAADDVMFALQFHEGGRLTATGTLRMLVRTAYRLQEFQLEGAAGWTSDEQFDIDGRAGRDATPDELRVMLRALLRERFGLVLRSEHQQAPVYALRVAAVERGARLRPASEQCTAGACAIRFSPGLFSARGVTMAAFASELSWWVDRVVTDQTAMPGVFDLDLEWAPDVVPVAPLASSTLNPPVAARVDSNAPSLFAALHEQLGLSLVPARGEIDVFVIERAERSSPN